VSGSPSEDAAAPGDAPPPQSNSSDGT